jgi:hypothetical protein
MLFLLLRTRGYWCKDLPEQNKPQHHYHCLLLSMTSIVCCSQGTNAHLILAAPAAAAPSSTLVTTGGAGVALQQQLAWQATRTWPLPSTHLIVSAVSMAGRSKAVFACQLDSPRLAFLHTHHVLQQPLLPTAALLEVAAAANAALSSGGSADGSSVHCLQGVVFAAPYLLTGQLADLTCSISLDSGVVEVQSAANSSRSNSKRLHMAATIMSAGVAVIIQAGSSSSRGQAGFLQQLLAAQCRDLQPGLQQPLCCSAAVQLSDSSSCGGLLSSNSPSDGFLLHPAALESALQMQALRQQQPTSDSAAEQSVSAPATIRAYLLPTAAAAAVQSAQGLLVSAALGVVQPGTAAAHSSMQLSSGNARVACITEAEFRPMQGGAATAAAALAAAGASQAATGAEAAAALPVSGVPAMGVEELLQLVQRTVEAVLGEAVDSQEPLMAAGLDSLGATEVRNSLQASLGLELPATLVSCRTHAAVSCYNEVKACMRQYAPPEVG